MFQRALRYIPWLEMQAQNRNFSDFFRESPQKVRKHGGKIIPKVFFRPGLYFRPNRRYITGDIGDTPPVLRELFIYMISETRGERMVGPGIPAEKNPSGGRHERKF